MSRRAQAPRRQILAEPKYGNMTLAKFINMVMKSGKKSAAEKIVYGAIERMAERAGNNKDRALELLSQALENIKPAVEVKSRRVGRRSRCVGPSRPHATVPRKAWRCVWRTS